VNTGTYTQSEWTVDGDALAMGSQLIVTASTFKPDGAPLAEGLANIRMASAAPALRQVAEQAREFLFGFFDDETQQPVITELLTALDNAIVQAGGEALPVRNEDLGASS